MRHASPAGRSGTPMPGLAFTGHGIDRADNTRADPELLAILRARPDAQLLLMEGLAPTLDEAGDLQWAGCQGLAQDAEIVFLGCDQERGGAPLFAPVPARGDIRPAYEQRASWSALARMSGAQLAIYGGARSLVDWHARHRFCANCGAPTHIAKGGWQRTCPACGAQHFPRVDPVAIMLVEHIGENGEGALLLGRSDRYPPRSYSALAGFIEPGEGIEDAVAREVLEEAGVVVRDVTYIASQPWPFPSQLMIGCHGYAEGRELVIDYTELEDARWFTRAEVAQALENGQASTSFVPPPETAIAHHLLRHWLENPG